MSEVERYQPNFVGGMQKTTMGGWVLASDYDALAAELAALKGGQVRPACNKCNGTGSGGGRQHPDGQYESYRCEECDGFGTAPPAQASAWVPEGWKVIAVNPAFDDLMYWLDRCDSKGHLDNCSDLIEPWGAFDYRAAPTPGASDGKGGE